MPTALRFAGLRVTIYPNDHHPAHVHVIGAGREAVFNLSCPEGPPELRESFGFAPHELNAVLDQLGRSLALLCDAWSRVHGDHR